MEETIQQLERTIDEAIVNGLIEATPESWKTIKLEIEWRPKQNGTEGFAHTITSPEGHRDIIPTSEMIYQQTFLLANLFKKHSKQWCKATYTASQSSGGEWKYSVDFLYNK
jgi:hypothetical protein